MTLTAGDEGRLRSSYGTPLSLAALRAALYEVLADTPGVRVNSHTGDDLGRAAVEISRTATATGIEDQTFENPKTGAVLGTAFVYPDGTTGTDLYMSVTSRDTLPQTRTAAERAAPALTESM
jgi:hypothetical protein